MTDQHAVADDSTSSSFPLHFSPMRIIGVVLLVGVVSFYGLVICYATRTAQTRRRQETTTKSEQPMMIMMMAAGTTSPLAVRRPWSNADVENPSPEKDTTTIATNGSPPYPRSPLPCPADGRAGSLLPPPPPPGAAGGGTTTTTTTTAASTATIASSSSSSSSVVVETTVEATATAKCTTRDTTAKTGYVVPGRLDDEVESTASWVDVVRGRSKAVNGKQDSDKLSLFTNRKY